MEMTNEEIQDQHINKVLSYNCGYENVNEWLLGMGLGQYYNLFIEHGYDSFKVCSEIQRIDIETIGIWDQFHVNMLTKGLTKMNNSKAQSVYHRLSVATPDDNEFKSLADELNITPSPMIEHSQTNGFHSSKLTENFYKNKPTLAEKRSVRTQLIQLNVDLSDNKYTDGSPSLDELAEEISQNLNLEALSVYDILCLMRNTALENSSTKPNKQPVVNCISNGDVATVSPLEDVFSENNSPMSPPPNPPKAYQRPKKPPRSIANTEEKPSLSSLTNGDPIQSVSTQSISTSSTASVPEPVFSAYDILHADSLEPLIMTNVKSPLKQANKPEDTPSAASSVTSTENLIEETIYIQLDGSANFTENVIQKPKPTSSGIFKKTRSNTKKSQEDILKKPPNQPPPPPPPPATPAQEVDNSAGKSKTSKLVKRESKSHITEDTTDNLTTTTTNENKSKKQTSFFKRSTKPRETKVRHKKSKDESDLVNTFKDAEEAQVRKRMSKNLSKSSDNLFGFISSQECNEEQNNLKSKQPKNQENPTSSPPKSDLLKKTFITHIPDLIPIQTNGDDPSQSLQSLPPNPIPRRRNSPEDIIRQISNPLPRQNSENRAQPPKKPKRNISDDLVYDNVEQVIPNPIPRYKQADSPPLPNTSDFPPLVYPQRSYTVSSRPKSLLTSSDTKQPTILGRDISCNNIARVKPDIPKGKKPVLKAKPAIDATLKRDKLNGENQQRGKDGTTENVITRITSPLTAPALPTTKRPDTPSNSNQPPEPPPIHLIPSMRPVAHVRPTRSAIITPSVSNSSPIAEPRNVDNWKKIEDRIWSVLKEEDFLDYLISHYTRENGESGITPGLVCRLATETSFAIHHIASALDNIRITRLNELGRSAIPISLIQFDEMETPTYVDNVSTWLTSIGLPNYIQVFNENVKDPKEIKNIDADDLSEFFISSKHRGCLLHAIDMLQ